MINCIRWSPYEFVLKSTIFHGSILSIPAIKSLQQLLKPPHTNKNLYFDIHKYLQQIIKNVTQSEYRDEFSGGR
jgi:hypothetical protein